jgi:glycosyltransferase involved in cell wall biosynthesis
MRIAILTNAFPPRAHGGCGRIAFIYAELLKARGHEVKVWGPQVWFYRLAKMPALFRLYFHLRDLGSQDKTIREITDWKPDALLTHNLTGCGFATPRDIRDAGVRWVHMLHDVQLFEPSGQIISGESWFFLRRLWRKIWAMLRRRSLGEPDSVISPTRWLLAEHQKFGFFKRSKPEVSPNPLGPDELAVLNDGSASIVRDPRAIAYVGRLDSDKGIDALLRAWQRIRHAASKLRLIGDGRLRGAIDALHDPKIQVGYMEHAELLTALRSCGVCVVPSLVMENQPTVILEALACGSRVVATDVGGVAETLGGAGWLVKPNAEDDLVQALLEAMEQTEKLQLESARHEILKLHEPEACVSRLEGLLKSNL